MDKNNKSKYLRDDSKPKSKYANPNKPKSRYLKSKDDGKPVEKTSSKAHKAPEYRESVITPKRAHELMEQPEEPTVDIVDVVEEGLDVDIADIADYVDDVDDIERKGTDSDIFKGESNDRQKRKAYRKKSYEDSNREKRQRKTLRKLLCIIGLGILAAFLQFLTIKIPFVPKIFVVDFAALPELIAAIAYGPLIGVVICLLKVIIFAVIQPSNAISGITSFILDAVFVFIAGWMYSRSMFKGDNNVRTPDGNRKKGYRRKRILYSSVLGALISLVPQFFITRYILFPLIDRFYSSQLTTAQILEKYQVSAAGLKGFLPSAISRFIPEIHNISQGILMFNIPVTFAKLVVVSIVTALIYKYISPFLHYRDVKKKSSNKKSSHSHHHSHHSSHGEHTHHHSSHSEHHSEHTS